MKKYKQLIMTLAVASMVLQVGCEEGTLETTGTISTVVHILGAVAFAAAGVLWLFRHQVWDFIRGKKNIKLLIVGLALLLLSEGRIFAQGISFQPAVTTFQTILQQFAGITAGACGFFGLTRVAWLLVNEERSSGTALIMSIVGFVVATIAVGLL